MTRLHAFRLIFEDEYGDFARCSCGAQGFDFKQGKEWFAEHLASLPPPNPTTPQPAVKEKG